MTIVGFSLTKILLERKETPIRKLEVKSKLQLISMERQEVKLVEGKDTLRFNFEYDIIYQPDLATISFKGYVLFVADPKYADEIMKEWKKTKAIGKELQTNVYNFIFQKCNIKALEFEDEFGLPPHIQLPQIKIEEIKEKDKK